MAKWIKKTAECVSPSHPDKVCDQIADAILDECLKQDPQSRAAIEVMGGHGIIAINGEIATQARIEIDDVARTAYRGCGYDSPVEIVVNLKPQSREIGQAVDQGGAGDQGIMVGYACCENKSLIPEELYLARGLAEHIYKNHQSDGKTQATIAEKDDRFKIETIVASFCGLGKEELEGFIKSWLSERGFSGDDIRVEANPAGDWSQGGFDADTGLTGRKIVVDNYGPYIPIGGGSFSGKDPSKVDRSGAYVARNIAVQALNQLKAREVFVYLAYAIGLEQPVMKTVRADDKCFKLEADLSFDNINKSLELWNPQYCKTSQWGHFGRGFNWDNGRKSIEFDLIEN